VGSGQAAAIDQVAFGKRSRKWWGGTSSIVQFDLIQPISSVYYACRER
jgi:hypothetical protein